jgi:hypothetical protein
MWSDTKVSVPAGDAASLDAKLPLVRSTWRPVVPSQGCWVQRAPAVSILQLGPVAQAVADRLSARHARVQIIALADRGATHAATFDQHASDIHAAVIDTDVTLIEEGTTRCALADLLTVAARLGCELQSKPAYHVVVVLGTDSGARETMTMVAQALEDASGKHLGPDYGLCLVLGLAGQTPAHAPTLWATDRRAGETVRALFDVVGEGVALKPLFLQPSPSC